MTATEELRRMLDERGVEHFDGTESTLWGYESYNEVTGIYRFSADESSDGYMQVRLWHATPEQAIAATLGTGTCIADETETISVRGDTWGYYFDKHFTIHVMECSECGHTYEHVNGDYEFCPHCGRRVVEVNA